MSLFLTRAQLCELTGYLQKCRQVRWLQAHGIPHYVRRDGHPVVAASVLQEGAASRSQPPAQPDFAALRANH